MAISCELAELSRKKAVPRRLNRFMAYYVPVWLQPRLVMANSRSSHG